jgi:hypothetical protein
MEAIANRKSIVPRTHCSPTKMGFEETVLSPGSSSFLVFATTLLPFDGMMDPIIKHSDVMGDLQESGMLDETDAEDQDTLFNSTSSILYLVSCHMFRGKPFDVSFIISYQSSHSFITSFPFLKFNIVCY